MKKKTEKGYKRVSLKMAVLFVSIFLSGCQRGNTVPIVEDADSGMISESSSTKTEDITESDLALDNRKEEEEVSIVTARYEQDKILITYPQFEEIEKDLSIEKINEQIKQDALKILEFYEVIKEDTLEVSYEIKGSFKTDISIVYKGYYLKKGASYPINIIYTSNLELKDVSRYNLAERVDLEQMAQNIVDGKYQIVEKDKREFSEAIEQEIMRYTKEDWIENLKKTDFRETSYEAYPEWFSYWEWKGEERIDYFIIPVIHALGDYVIIQVEGEDLKE